MESQPLLLPNRSIALPIPQNCHFKLHSAWFDTIFVFIYLAGKPRSPITGQTKTCIGPAFILDFMFPAPIVFVLRLPVHGPLVGMGIVRNRMERSV